MTKTKTEFASIPKCDDFAFGKDVYLLGEDADGIKYWLEAPSWDCDWYWGFGYIETYTRNATPSRARDMQSHEHATRFYPEWVHGENARLVKTTFTEKEAWELAELFKQFYLFQDLASLYHNGTAGVTTAKVTHEDKEKWNEINKTVIPKITKAIIKILT